MRMKPWYPCLILLVALAFVSCAAAPPKLPVDKHSVPAGSQVTFKGKTFRLLGDPVSVGDPLPSSLLVESKDMSSVDLSKIRDRVLFLSIVPSIDTKVCEAQTHVLAEEGDGMSNIVERITVSRDTPFAQMRFAEAAGLDDVRYLSDYKQGTFGRSLGLLTDDLMLLARAVVLVDKWGIVRYIQVVPEMTHLPDMDAAFKKADELAVEK